MGIGNTTIGLVARLRVNGLIPRRAAVIEIGAQQLTNSFLTAGDELASLGYLFGITTPPSLPAPLPTQVLPSGQEYLPEQAPRARDFWTWLGFDYASIDIDGSPGSIPLDLNYDRAPEAARGRYDLVTNFGTTEHVANQLNAFELIHDLVAPGGIMIHELPVHGYFNHGLINYNFKFFWMLSRSNHYKFVDALFSTELEEGLPDNIIEFLSEFEHDSPHNLRSADAGLRVVLQKRFDIPFIPPIDVKTGVATEHEVLRERYWTVFAPERVDALVDHSRSTPSAAKAALPVEAESAELPPKQAGAPAEWLLAESPVPLPLPQWSGTLANGGTERRSAPNALEDYQPLLDALEPWRGVVPKGFLVDFFGVLTDANFRTLYGVDPATVGDNYTTAEVPTLLGGNGEWWFEAINWVEAAREARDHFVMITLGAAYGAQAVGAHRVLQMINPMPCKLVAVEPVPENHLWLRKHFRDNGIDPDQHWIVSAAISNSNDPVYFPVGGAGAGANNCIATDTPSERKILLDRLVAQGRATEVLSNIMLRNTTGVMKDLLPGQDVVGEIELLSAVTLRDLLSPLERVDYLEADIQQSEARVFPPYIELLRKKVRRIHLGTHGAETHAMLHKLFEEQGWEIVFSYPPDGVYQSKIGSFSLNDGVLTVRNSDLK